MSTFDVPAELDGERLDRALVRLVPGMSRARAKRAIEASAVRVNGKRCAKGAVLAKGDKVSVEEEQLGPADAPPLPQANASLAVRYESGNVIVVDKPAGQPTAPLRADETGTLANALVARFPELAGIGYAQREPGLVHRLDGDTSGLVLVARTAKAFEELKAALKADAIEKSYLLVCASEGLADEGTIEFPIASHPKDQRRVLACVHPRDVMRYAPRPATTRYRVEKRAGAWALVRAEVARALRHQIRAHFAAIDHPLAGDALYGGPQAPGLARHALHAARIAYEGGEAVERFDVKSPLPDDMQALVG